MSTQASKFAQNDSHSAAGNQAVQKQDNNAGAGFEDNRPQAIAQRQLQQVASNSPRVQQLKALQQTANNSSAVKQLRAVQALANSSKNLQHNTVAGNNTVQLEAAGVSKYGMLTGNSDKAKQLGINKTKVSFNTDKLASTGETVGVTMTANPLGPDHPQGSSPDNAASKKHIDHFNKYDTYIRGHLLNGNIGGPGIAENLFPITAQANSLHYQLIEKYVEEWVNTFKYYVYYQVEVKNRNDKNGEADLECKAYPIDTNGNITKSGVLAVIRSKPGGSKGKNEDSDTKNNNAIDEDKNLKTADIEYQKGKFPVGYLELDQNLEGIMEKDYQTKGQWGGNVLEEKLSKILTEEAAEKVVLAYMSEDPAVWQNTSKGAWNKWMKLVNDNYK